MTARLARCLLPVTLLLAAGCASSDADRDDARPTPSASASSRTGADGVPLAVLMSSSWSEGIGSDIPGQTFCPDVRTRNKTPATEVSCRFVVPRGTAVKLTAKVRERHPALTVSNEGVRLTLCPHGVWSEASRTVTCTVTVTEGTALCLDDNMPHQSVVCEWVAQGYARLPATAPPGFRPGPHQAARPDEPFS
ncbi:hypothetical protein [Streptomyces sp. NPDC013455]|uniref:hypothetical protein n=1 Tax=Streptomyces sp. NPDC013455 TaxID=3155605 RepID=UPI0033EDA568